MKKAITGVLLTCAMLLLTACGSLNFDGGSTTTSNGKSTGKYQTTGTGDDNMYPGVIRNGRYQTSSARGLTLQQNTQGGNSFNVRSMETGLLGLAKAQFDPGKYVFQEGQLLTTATATKWLGRESADNSAGLNPKDNGKDGETERAPMYLQSILEQDFMLEDGDRLKYGGVAIALGLNEFDYYQKEKYGATYTTTISEADLTAQGKAMAAKVVARVRKMSGVSANTPILIALYKNAARDSLVGGTVTQYALSKSGDNLSDWTKTNQANEVLPVVDNQAPINKAVASDFDNFATKIEGFFPTLAGVTAQAHYENGELRGLNVTINTQFYGETEIQSFTQTVASNAAKYLPKGVQIDITVQATSGIQAFVARASGEKDFTTHVFSSY